MDAERIPVPFWESRYRASMSDPGRMYIAERFEDVPDVVKAYATRRTVRVPDDQYMRRDFNLIEFLKAVYRYRR